MMGSVLDYEMVFLDKVGRGVRRSTTLAKDEHPCPRRKPRNKCCHNLDLEAHSIRWKATFSKNRVSNLVKNQSSARIDVLST